MSANPTFWYSEVEYRPDPGAPAEQRIPLGIAFEALTSNLWLVSIFMRAFLTPQELKQMDEIGGELLQHPGSFMEKEVEAVLTLAKRPGEVLRLLSERNMWSFRVSAPKKPSWTPKVEHPLSPRRLVDRFVHELYSREVGFACEAPSVPGWVPPPWALPPRIWEVPLHGVGSRQRAEGR